MNKKTGVRIRKCDIWVGTFYGYDILIKEVSMDNRLLVEREFLKLMRKIEAIELGRGTSGNN